MTESPGADADKGFCPVCGVEVRWIATSHLWPSRRAAREILPSRSGTCSGCGRVLMFTVLNESAHDAGSRPAGDSAGDKT
ncbi:MAG: hypothetical protein WCN81_13025 [Actinomycetes bacterium]